MIFYANIWVFKHDPLSVYLAKRLYCFISSYPLNNFTVKIVVLLRIYILNQTSNLYSLKSDGSSANTVIPL